MVSLSRLFHLTACLPRRGPTTPMLPKQHRFGLFRVRSPLLAESHFVFSSYGYLDVSVPRVRFLFEDDRPSACRVAPFGHPRIKGHLHLPTAFRSLSRPSSPPRAKASTVCPCLLSSSFTTLRYVSGSIFLQLALLFLFFLVVQHVKDLFRFHLAASSFRGE